MRIGLVEFLLILAIASLTIGPQVALFVDRWMRRANRANARAARRRKEQPRPPRQQDKRRGKQDHVNDHGGKGGMEAEQLIKGEQEADGHQDAADGIHTGIPQRLFEAPGRP